MSEEAWSAAGVAELSGRLRAFLLGYLRDRSAEVDLDDVVQEALARTWAARDRLGEESVAAFALVTARNLALSQLRAVAAAGRAYDRIPVPEQPRAPHDVAERADRARILAEALAGLPLRDQEALLRHDVEEEPLSAIAGDETSPTALAARLARTRAQLRVNYVLAAQRVRLPTPRCRPVLVALSASDQRRLRETRAVAHLAECEACARLAEPLSARRLPAGWLVPGAAPLASVDGPPPWWRTATRRALRPRNVTVAAVVAGAVVAGAFAADRSPEPVQQAAPAPSPGMLPVLAAPTPPQPRATTTEVRLVGARVLAVPADEGFWVQAPPQVRRLPGQSDRLWVQLRIAGGESPAQVDAGDLVDGTGRLEPTPSRFAARVGVTAAEGARDLDRQPLHLVMPVGGLRVTAGG
ncbi:RNA polymerase sigma factor [Motilibacter deserti]|uniref:Sigma-70 family RNA polymerase sigma factor n=1 Tax=Motilibacter deserti TaxID=2714956 RepID=A0ABX0GSY6_9ACTN|nr:sigma-70 family RNA polymerase sigma factor [Motilibacter deserti]NHC13999.1 sigma-70 family RNA polymerase sigma factor [Motilibacter deserti]